MRRDTAAKSACWVGVVAAFIAGAAHSIGAVGIAAGPYYNSVTGHRYYRLTGGNWSALRAFAVSMGGDLATINDDAENTWVRANVVGGSSKPFIGLNDASAEGTLVWADGSANAFRKWRAGEPLNNANNDYVNFDGTPEGTWMISQANYTSDAIMETSGPIHVPAEQPNLNAAVAAQPTSGTSEIILSAGTHVLLTTVGLSNVTVRGAGRDQTYLWGPPSQIPEVPSDEIAIQMNGGALLEDLQLINRAIAPSLAAEVGVNRARRVDFVSWSEETSDDLVQNNFGQAPTMILENCELRSSEFAIDINSGAMLVSNCIFRDLGGVALTSQSGTTLLMSNCVVTRCGPGPMFDSPGTKTIENTIFYGNTGFIGGGVNTSVRNSNVQAGQPGVGNFSGDPRFVDAAANDFRLIADSPCIDRGNVVAYMDCRPQELTDFAGMMRVVDDPAHANAFTIPIDLGAIEFAASAEACPGDLNHDAMVDDADFQIFLVAYNKLVCE
ncbi:MAG: right-handed parallel beta-helix repeat-containing protein [Phycisphaerales bacterium]